MKLLSFFLLFSGWVIVVAALLLLASPGSRTAFVMAGFAVEILGLVFGFRCHVVSRGE